MDSQANPDSRLNFSRFVAGIFFRLSFLLILVGSATCAPSEQSNLGVQSFEGVTLDGQTIRLSDIQAERIALNVYGPNCVPCIKEVPVLNYLYKDLASNPRIKLYMVVDPTVFVDSPEKMTEEQIIKEANIQMREEIRKYGIKLPVLIMKKPFRISRNDGLVTGTPETLLFKTKPLVLYYNFIGPISEESDVLAIPKDGKVIFFKRMAGSV
ncbi:antioxidant, AhpC/TSA family [Leptospira inadai serovar Lyme str. 10]|uniref:Antioxidant, AhpC/TSA family n=2 Tax=Leptospira inadai serovar Lyme TaxID=293084 RepID=V6HVQ3_9LEPT|nr:TlpA disulfide reductase family protein [Leptospira inadai]EQA36949.1 antioxidant, AhpC/TSA family [Leptospira inadai serovar Lyme str. 10]PNV75685.1 TlpA family protein disulfide reductase [Leptospira inadai serovar Lyme]